MSHVTHCLQYTAEWIGISTKLSSAADLDSGNVISVWSEMNERGHAGRVWKVPGVSGSTHCPPLHFIPHYCAAKFHTCLLTELESARCS